MVSPSPPASGADLTFIFGPLAEATATPAPAGATTTPETTSTEAAALAADPGMLASCGVDGMESQVLAILGAYQHKSLAEVTAVGASADGGVAIDSLSAVFVCTIIRGALGPKSLRALMKDSKPSEFLSTRALAGLLVRTRDKGSKP